MARPQQQPHHDILLLALSDDAGRRESQAAEVRARNAQLSAEVWLEVWH